MEALAYNLNFDLKDSDFNIQEHVEKAVVLFAYDYAIYRSEDTEPHVYEGKELSDVQKVIDMLNMLTHQSLGLMRGADLIIRIGEQFKTNKEQLFWATIQKCLK